MNSYQEYVLLNENFFSQLLQDIYHAKKSICLQTYIFNEDEVGKKIFTALCDAAQRGVRVRVLIDGVGSLNWKSENSEILHQQGGFLRIYHPLPWKLYHWMIGTHLKPKILSKAIHLLNSINARNHRKTCVIDHTIIYVGSANITDNSEVKINHITWHDITLKLIGNSKELDNAFDTAWGDRSFNEKLKTYFFPKTESIFRLNDNWIKRRMLYKDLLKKINHCHEQIKLITPYFIPRPFFSSRLKKAVKRGVQVTIIIPINSDIKLLPLVIKTFYKLLMDAGIQIYESDVSEIMHAKIMVLDNWICLGSSNINNRSLKHDLEADIVVQHETTKKFIIDYVNEYGLRAHRVTHADLGKYTFFSKLLGKFLLYLRYWF